MRIFRIFLPGRFEDAYLYMGRLIVLTEDKAIRAYSLDLMARVLEERFPDIKPVPTVMFSQNNLLSRFRFSSLIESEEPAKAILSAFRKFPQPQLEIDEREFLLKEMALDIPVLIFLDMSIYSGRLYIAADNGLYELDISWQDSGSISLGKVKKKIDGKCYSISAKYGAVSASCGEDGLYIFLNDLGWWKQGSSSKLVTLDRMSLRSSWLDSYLVNYRTHEQPYLFQSHLERFEYKSEGEGRVITSINQQSLDLSYFLSHAIDEAGIEERSIQYVYNFERRFFVRTRANNFFSLNIIPSSQGEVSIRDIKKYTTPVERVLSVSNGKLGPIIETFDRVLFISEERGETYPITEVGAIAVKTFPRSRRFQNMVVVTTEDGIFLVGLFDDSELHQ